MPAKNEKSSISPEVIELYNKLVATIPEVERKGATVPYTSHNGHMFSYLEKDGTLGLRLPAKLIEPFILKYKTSLFVSYGIVKKEFVLVPDKLQRNIKELKPWFAESFAYVKKLKPKPTKK